MKYTTLTDKIKKLLNDKFEGSFRDYCDDNDIQMYLGSWTDNHGDIEYELNDNALNDCKRGAVEYVKNHQNEFGITDDTIDDAVDYILTEIEF